MTYDEFVGHVRDALAHLYDPVHLQRCPLASEWLNVQGLDHITRAQKLRRMLLAALEQLDEPEHGMSSQDARAAYSALHYRYLDGLSPEQIADTLAMSPRQVYRKLRDGSEAIASLLWDQEGQQLGTAPRPVAVTSAGSLAPDRRSLAQASVQQLGSQAGPEAQDLRKILESVAGDLQPYYRQRDSEIQLALPTAPLFVYVDRTMLRQAMINLLTSGLDASGAPAVEVQASRASEHVRVTLAAVEAREDYARPLAAREGIGLEVAEQLLALQGIRIQRHDTPGAWRVDLLFTSVDICRILVVDDMPDIVELFRRYAGTHAVEIAGAANAAEAFTLLSQMTPDLVVLDVMLPRRDGWEVLQTLKADPGTAHIPVLICSILNEPGLAAALGADGYLAKPVSQEALLQALARWCPRSQAPAAAPS